ncbi:MAG: YgiQ family radical SAM protein [Bacteroidetes bacterium]|nr:YgiQ family radical SAM protein [Bacteroidota bacterium]
MRSRGWEQLDVILVTGDAYIDAPQIGVALIGRVLERAGYRVGVIAQPDWNTDSDILRLGEPRLFWGVTAGSVDSMVANYTALQKPRRTDDYTPGGKNTRRPDRAGIAYSNLIRRFYKNTVPIVLGGLEASLRRVAHYDYWTDRIRRSILFDAKADILVYGMGERAILEIANLLNDGAAPDAVRGTCVISRTVPEDALILPAYDECAQDHTAFLRMFRLFYDNTDPVTARPLAQQHGDRWLLQHPPQPFETQEELDAVHALPFARDAHPIAKREGEIRALDTIQFSLQTHRGCYGECNFCAIAVHEGRRVRWRSEESILAEAAGFGKHPAFKGIIPDVGGPTANMYGYECEKKISKGACTDKRCVFPELCRQLPVDHSRYTDLLHRLRTLPGIRHVFVASGIRHDLVMDDTRCGMQFMEELVGHHVSGRLKLAPDHSDPAVLSLMGKGGTEALLDFRERFFTLSRRFGKRQFLSYYFIAAYPGSEERHMLALREFAAGELAVEPEQVQIFTPTPGTWASVMYHTGLDPFTGKPLSVERGLRGKRRQKEILAGRDGKTGSERSYATDVRHATGKIPGGISRSGKERTSGTRGQRKKK